MVQLLTISSNQVTLCLRAIGSHTQSARHLHNLFRLATKLWVSPVQPVVLVFLSGSWTEQANDAHGPASDHGETAGGLEEKYLSPRRATKRARANEEAS